jgi:hypothetical protein
MRSKTLRRRWAALVWSLVSFGLAGATVQGQSNPNSQVDTGVISGDVYTNSTFRMRYQIPRGWYIDKEAMRKANEDSRRFLKNESPTIDYESSVLLDIIERPSKVPPAPVTRIQLSASKIVAGSRTQSPSDLLDRVKDTWSRIPRARVIRGPGDCAPGPASFSCLYIQEPVGEGGFVYEGELITAREGYFVQFQVFATTAEELTELVARVFRALRFQP